MCVIATFAPPSHDTFQYTVMSLHIMLHSYGKHMHSHRTGVPVPHVSSGYREQLMCSKR